MWDYKKIIKGILCTHYYEDRPSIKFYGTFMSQANPNGFGDMKLVICNKCGHTTYKPYNFIDIKQIT